MELKVVRSDDQLTHLALSGRLDVAEHTKAKKPVVVDMSEVSFLASLGIRMLFQGAKALFADGSKLVILKPQPLVEEILQTAGLTEIMPIVQDENEIFAQL